MPSTLYLNFRKTGPAWIAGTTTRQQPLWDQHAAFIDKLFEQGRIIMAGPYADLTGALVIIKAASATEASQMFADDPWTTHGILLESKVIEWTVFLDAHQNSG